MKLPKLHYFDRSEFVRDEDWFPLMSPRLLVLLDTFRHLTGKCIISPNKDAIGRRDDTDSQHNVEKWGEVRAVDVFPTMEPRGLKEKWKIEGEEDGYFLDSLAEEWVYQAKKIGFTGIGIYPNWTYKGEQRPGMHLDVRDGTPGDPVTWGRIGNEYVSLDKAMEVLA